MALEHGDRGYAKMIFFPYKNKFHQTKVMKFSLKKNWNVKNIKYPLLKQFNQAILHTRSKSWVCNPLLRMNSTKILNSLSLTDRRSTKFKSRKKVVKLRKVEAPLLFFSCAYYRTLLHCMRMKHFCVAPLIVRDIYTLRCCLRNCKALVSFYQILQMFY